MTSVAPPREICTPAYSLDQVLTQLRALHVDVRTYEMPAEHVFDCCGYACDGDLPAAVTVYPRDGASVDCCLACLLKATGQAIEDSNGREEFCTVEIATVAPPRPSVVLVPAQRQHDLAALSPLLCDVCPTARNSVARFELTFGVIRHGESEAVRWILCPLCVESCMHAAQVQHDGFTPPALSVLPVTTREDVAA